MTAEDDRAAAEIARRARLLPAGLLPLSFDDEGLARIDPRIEMAVVAAVAHAHASGPAGGIRFEDGEALIEETLEAVAQALGDLLILCCGLAAPAPGEDGLTWRPDPGGDPRGRRAAFIRGAIAEAADA